MRKQIEREYDQLDRDLLSGLISHAGYREELRLIQQYDREVAEEAALSAYEAALDSFR